MDFLGVNAQLLGGFKYTLLIFFITLVAAIPLGLPIALGSMSRFKPLRWISRAFVWVIRGTPLMLQIMVVFYVPGLVFGTPFRSRIIAVIIAFIINYAAYFSEIYRGGIESIPVGQYEAGQVLGLTKTQTFFKVTLPLLGPSMTTCVFMSLTNGLKVFDIILALTKGGPGRASYSATLQIYNEAFTNNNFGLGSAEAILYFLFVLVITQLVLKGMSRKEVDL